jgi:hypothetical protein
MNFKFSNQIRMENEKGALLHWAASTEAWPSQLRSGPTHLAFQPMGPKQGTRSSSSRRLFTSEIRLAGGGSSGMVLLGRKPWWRGTQFGVLDGEGPDSDSPGSSSRGRLGSWLGLRSTVARGTRLGCSSAMAYRCIAAAEQSKEREQREEEAKWWRSPLPTHA